MSLANDLDWTKFGKMILTPLMDIDNLNLFKIKPLWSLMTKGEKNKDISTWGEMVYKDSEKTTKGERNKDISDRGKLDIGGEI